MTETPLPENVPSSSNTVKGSRRGAVVGGAAALVLLAGAAVAGVAYSKLHSSDDYAYAHLDSSAFAYVQTNLDPSAKQKINADTLIKKFPELKKNHKFKGTTVQNLNGKILNSLLDSKVDTSWVGDRMAVAAYPDDSDGNKEPEVALFIKTTDVDEARQKLPALLNSMNKDGDRDDRFAANVYDNDWIGITNDANPVFDTDSTLADTDAFTDNVKPIQGNLVASWVDLKGAGGAAKAATGKNEDLAGFVTADLSARTDGLDLTTHSTGVKLNGKALYLNGNDTDAGKLLAANEYKGGALNLGIEDPATLVENGLKNSDTNLSQVGLSEEQLPNLLGKTAALSVGGNTVDTLKGKIVFDGVDEDEWNSYLQTLGVSPASLGSLLQSELGRPASFTLNDGQASLQVGSSPEGGAATENGQITGSVNIDSVVSIIDSVSFFGEKPEKTKNGDFGVVTFHGSSDKDGNGEARISWTTPR